jgi:hypothetical protein
LGERVGIRLECVAEYGYFEFWKSSSIKCEFNFEGWANSSRLFVASDDFSLSRLASPMSFPTMLKNLVGRTSSSQHETRESPFRTDSDIGR